MSEGIDYRPNGTIRIEFDGETWTLTRPKFKIFRKHFERLAEWRGVLQDITKERLRLQDQSAGTDNVEELEAIHVQIKQLNAQPLWDSTLPLILEILADTADRPLPDVDEWPAWLAANAAIPGVIVNHWNEVPKAPGVAGSS